MTLDRALDGVPFRIDLFRCHEAARALAGYMPVQVVEPWSTLPAVDQLVFKVLFISICHQMNWDVLQNALARWLLPNPRLRLEEFSRTTPKQIAHLLKDYPKQERVRARERAAMLRRTAESLVGLLAANAPLDQVVRRPVLGGQDGFYAAITAIGAYTGDPLDKKARVLAHDLYRENILPFSDPENLKPAVEYHLIRLYLRSGRVYPVDDSVRDELTGKMRPTRTRLVKVLRETVDEAMRSTAFYAGLDIATLNYVEWQLARSICVPELGPETASRYCLAPAGPDVPADIRELVPGRCPYSQACRTLNDERYGWYHEPQFEKAIY